MPLYFKQGDLFEQDVDAIVNTVNCVGIMGKGVALEFKRRWPDNYLAYKRVCAENELSPGKLFIHQTRDLFSNDPLRYIINFPTKSHWRSKSKIEYIDLGLDALLRELDLLDIRSIAMPPLGCGNGGLSWSAVKSLIESKLQNHKANIIVLEPKDKLESLEQDVEPISMTLQRAALFKTLGELEDVFLGGFDRLSIQKIVYFLQEFGVKYGLEFNRSFFGPYFYGLKRACATFDRLGLISGFSSEERTSHVSAGGHASADEFLEQTGQREYVEKLVRRLSQLIDGYESPYGLELLASVHHFAKHRKVEEGQIVEELNNWTEESRNKFSSIAISAAYGRLKEDRVI